MYELKRCPFCGGKLIYDDRKMTVGSTETECHCDGCQMKFSYYQDFVLSRKSRVPINASFETIWNRRVEDGK